MREIKLKRSWINSPAVEVLSRIILCCIYCLQMYILRWPVLILSKLWRFCIANDRCVMMCPVLIGTNNIGNWLNLTGTILFTRHWIQERFDLRQRLSGHCMRELLLRRPIGWIVKVLIGSASGGVPRVIWRRSWMEENQQKKNVANSIAEWLSL